MPKNLRDKVKQAVKKFQQEELNKNLLAQTDIRHVIIVCIAEVLPKIREMTLQEFRQKVQTLKAER
jgi:ribosomal protein L29